MTRTEFCLFTAQEDLETMQAYAQVANKDDSRSSGGKSQSHLLALLSNVGYMLMENVDYSVDESRFLTS